MINFFLVLPTQLCNWIDFWLKSEFTVYLSEMIIFNYGNQIARLKVWNNCSVQEFESGENWEYLFLLYMRIRYSQSNFNIEKKKKNFIDYTPVSNVYIFITTKLNEKVVFMKRRNGKFLHRSCFFHLFIFYKEKRKFIFTRSVLHNYLFI